MMNVLQLTLIFFGLFMVYTIRINRRKNQIGKAEAFLWTSMWILFIVVNIVPQSFRGIAESLQVARVFDLLVIFTLMILTFLTFQNRFQQKQLQRKFEEFIRLRALEKKKDDNE